jgi:hypothetical protein
VEEDRKMKQVMVAYTTFLITQRQAKRNSKLKDRKFENRQEKANKKKMCQLKSHNQQELKGV